MSHAVSIVVPVFKNEESIDRLLNRVTSLASSLVGDVEAIFVVDGSPDS